MNYKLIDMKVFGVERGKHISLESQKNLPFDIKCVYWENPPESKELHPINFLSYNLFEHYKKQGFEILNIGTSTVGGVSNICLCGFKESIGCSYSPKINWVMGFNL